jgi:hypothetical protein
LQSFRKRGNIGKEPDDRDTKVGVGGGGAKKVIGQLLESARARRAELTGVERKYVRVDVNGDVLHLHASVFRFNDGDRLIVMDHRATMPNPMQVELRVVSDLIAGLAEDYRKMLAVRQKSPGSSTGLSKNEQDAITSLGKTHILLTADRSRPDQATEVDVLLDADLVDIKGS